jgi:carboxyl-terminal processing protease
MMTKRLWALVAVVGCLAGGARADEPFTDGQKTFERTRELILRQHADDKLSDAELWRAATSGMLAAGGKWDKLLSPSELAELTADLRGELVGLGVQIDVDDRSEMVSIVGVVPGAAAARAGLLPGDRILRVDGKPLKGPDAMTVARSLRGRAGTTVTLTLLRDAQVLTRTIKRAPFVFEPVVEQSLPGGLALVQIRAFTEKTPGLLKAALAEARAAGMKGLVLDLRDNSGGLFDSMLKCAGQLLPKGSLVVTAIHRGGKIEEERTATEPGVSGVPMAALVNGATASGAEMLAGAMQSVGARVIGKRTLGKWNAQSIEDLGNGWAAKLTIAWFRAPSGQMLDGKGLEPDVEVELEPRQWARAVATRDIGERLAADAQLRAAVNLLKLSTR